MYMYVHGPHLVWPISWGLNKTSVNNCTCSSSILSTRLVIQPSFFGEIMRKLQGLQKQLSGRLSCWVKYISFLTYPMGKDLGKSSANQEKMWAKICPGQAKFESYLSNRQDGFQFFFGFELVFHLPNVGLLVVLCNAQE